ncbi:MAG: hypothetical protein CMM58_12935 [Rhodospirillaceae bacterium]|nr:hypothetical protein [Rhodospirillaceae bacterium]
MSTYSKAIKKLSQGDILVLDGGTGTELEKRGVPMEPGAWCGAAALEHSEILEQVHFDYIQAGADIITANTYSSSRLMLRLSGYDNNFLEINKNALSAAHRAKSLSTNPEDILIAGSLSHRGMLTKATAVPDTNAYPSIEKMEEDLTELAFFLKDEGSDLLILEMMYDPDRMEAAFSAASKTDLPIWAGFSARRGKENNLLSFLPGRDIPLQDIYKILTRYKVDAAGVMHTPSSLIYDAVLLLKNCSVNPIFAYPDSGYFRSPNWQFENTISKSTLVAFAREWLKVGVQIVGGCCGLSPEHIKALSTLKRASNK